MEKEPVTTVEVYPPEGAVKSPVQPIGALGISRERFLPGEEKRRSGRISRWSLKTVQRGVTESSGSRYCMGVRHGCGHVLVDVGAERIAHVSNVARCGSPWACTLCGPVIRQRRALEIDEGLGRWLGEGHGAEFVTHTVRHVRADPLAGRLAAVSRSLALSLCGQTWAGRAVRLGYVGAIKAVEVKWGQLNGWHPHSHSVLCFERPLSDVERAELRAWLYERWCRVVARRGFGFVHPVHGVDVQAVSAGSLGEYLTKVEGGWTAGLELVRGDLKAKGGVGPFELLARYAETGDIAARRLWLEYEAATRGKRALVWSRGLRDRLGVGVEASDEELAASEGADVALVRFLVRRALWTRCVWDGAAAELLGRAEDLAAALIAGGLPSGPGPVVVEWTEEVR